MRSSPDPSGHVRPQARIRVQGHDVEELCEAWEAAACAPGLCPDPGGLDALSWRPAPVPGTAAAALRLAGAWNPGQPHDFDAEDWWFRTSFDAAPAAAQEELVLHFGGIATVAEVYLNGERILASESMFQSHTVDVSELIGPTNELAIRCCALAPLLAQRRRPRARWRTRLVGSGNLRFFRTMLLGRAPGFAPGPAAVGPWRGVSLERRREVVVEDVALNASVDGKDGRLAIRVRLRALGGAAPGSLEVELSGPSGTCRAPMTLTRQTHGVEARAELRVAGVALWWPHTHGEPALHDVRVILTSAAGGVAVELGRVGFRTLAGSEQEDHDREHAGLDLHVNGVRVFARGAVWTPVDAVGLAPTEQALRRALEQVRDGGMNLLRIPGTSAYESETFYDLCDELGILVWQDFMFANFDYPLADEAFLASVKLEVEQVLDGLAHRPSVAVLCGNSEIEQQVAMLGLDPSLGRGELFGELLPKLARASASDAIYFPSAPCGGDQPFRPSVGIANYYGVGGYRRPLGDARRAEVRFAAECLAFSNVPDEAAIEEILPDAPGGVLVGHPSWKQGVPRDVGSGWDFEDVRDHYLSELFAVDPVELRSVDDQRYLELSRLVSGEAMAEVFGEWRRLGSPCGGGMVLWLRDLAPGAGWGVIDHRGEPKVAYHYLRRALAPVAVWTTDEGLDGIDVHVANDRPTPLSSRLRVALYRDCEHLLDEVFTDVAVAAHGTGRWNVESLLGRFVDVSWAYRFGPPQQDLVVVSLECGEDEEQAPGSQAMRFALGRPSGTEEAERLGLRASVRSESDGALCLGIRATRLAYGVRVRVPGFVASDDAFFVEPGRERVVRLRPCSAVATFAGGALTAANLRGRVTLADDPRYPVAAASSEEGAAA
jgi:beta-mannosidase